MPINSVLSIVYISAVTKMASWKDLEVISHKYNIESLLVEIIHRKGLCSIIINL